MRVKIGRFDYTECWDGVLYKNLSEYPTPTAWELQSVFDFIAYEKANGRTCEIEAEKPIVAAIDAYQSVYESGKRVPCPRRLTECKACPTYKGCMTDFVVHTTSCENAEKVFACGSILSSVRARKKSAEELANEARNAAKDPPDYFEYILFNWGNCQAGDRLVMERALGRFPKEEDLSIGFSPGVRFYFRYEDLAKHSSACFDGVLPLRIKDELKLEDHLFAAIIPAEQRKKIESYIPEKLKSRVHYLMNDCRDIWSWSEKVYEYIKTI